MDDLIRSKALIQIMRGDWMGFSLNWMLRKEEIDFLGNTGTLLHAAARVGNPFFIQKLLYHQGDANILFENKSPFLVYMISHFDTCKPTLENMVVASYFIIYGGNIELTFSGLSARFVLEGSEEGKDLIERRCKKSDKDHEGMIWNAYNERWVLFS